MNLPSLPHMLLHGSNLAPTVCCCVAAPSPHAPPPPPPPAAAPQPQKRADGRVIATPYAKKLAKDLGVDLNQVVGEPLSTGLSVSQPTMSLKSPGDRSGARGEVGGQEIGRGPEDGINQIPAYAAT